MQNFDEIIKSNNRKKIPLLGEFLIISSLATVIFAILAGWFGWEDFEARRDFIKLQIETESERIEHHFNDIAEHTDYLLSHINSQIKDKHNNYEFVKELLQTFSVSNRQSRDVFSTGMFSWSDENGQIIVNSERGILKEKIMVKDRFSMTQSKIKPNKLQFGLPTYGAISNQWILPFAMGITDDQGKYIGASLAGFAVDGLREILMNEIRTPAVNFVMLDNNHNFIMSTVDRKQNPTIEQIIDWLHRPELKDINNGFLNDDFFFSKQSLSYYIKSHKYPFIFIVIYDRAASDKEIYEALIAYNVEILLIGIVMICFFIVLRNRIVKPVIDLSNAAESIAKGENDVSIPKHEAYEISILADKLVEIHKVKRDLRKAQEQIKQANQKLEARVLERTFELEKALQSKSEFLNNMSHEIRTPIHGVQGYSEILIEDWDKFNDEKKFDLVKKLHKAGERLLELINNLLDLSKFTSGKMNLEIKENNLKDLVDQIVEESEPLYLNKKKLDIQVEIDGNANVTAEFDLERIKQVVRNLFANAIKFTASGTIKARIYNGELEYEDGTKLPALGFAISDEGIGIPEGELSVIFHAFSQSSKTKTFAGGTGLGLSICYEIIVAHHGTIWAENNHDKKGATLFFMIPFKQHIASLK